MSYADQPIGMGTAAGIYPPIRQQAGRQGAGSVGGRQGGYSPGRGGFGSSPGTSQRAATEKHSHANNCAGCCSCATSTNTTTRASGTTNTLTDNAANGSHDMGIRLYQAETTVKTLRLNLAWVEPSICFSRLVKALVRRPTFCFCSQSKSTFKRWSTEKAAVESVHKFVQVRLHVLFLYSAMVRAKQPSFQV